MKLCRISLLFFLYHKFQLKRICFVLWAWWQESGQVIPLCLAIDSGSSWEIPSQLWSIIFPPGPGSAPWPPVGCAWYICSGKQAKVILIECQKQFNGLLSNCRSNRFTLRTYRIVKPLNSSQRAGPATLWRKHLHPWPYSFSHFHTTYYHRQVI